MNSIEHVTLPPARTQLGQGREPPEVMHVDRIRTVDAGWDTVRTEYLIDGEWVPSYRVVLA